MNSARVHSLRKKREMSHRELTEVSGVSKRTVTNIEAGKVYSQVSTARKIGATLEVNPRSLATVASRA